MDSTDRLLRALRPKPKPQAPKPQMSPAQKAMAECQVAWAKHKAPHLLQPWLQKEEE